MTPTRADIDAMAPRRPSVVRFLLIAMIAPLVLIAGSTWLGHEYAATEVMRLQARASFDRRAEASTLIARIADAESSQRGFVLTGDPSFLDLYAPARIDVVHTFDKLAGELAGEPEQAVLLREISRLAARKFDEMDQVIADRRTRGLDAAIRRIAQGSGKALMDRMRALSGDMLAIAGRSRDARVEAYRQRVDEDRFWVWSGIACVGLLSLGGALLIWRQGTARYHARLSAFAVAKRTQSILDSTSDAIAILNPNGTIETVNAAACALLGYQPHELEGRDGSTVIDFAGPAASLQERLGLVGGKLATSWFPGRTLRHRDGHDVPVDIALGIMPQPDGDYVVASARDIAERQRIDRVKDELISTVSHELRTPLTSVVGALGLLRAGSGGELPDAAARLIEIAENNSRRLIRLINDMLDIDRIQADRLRLERAAIDLRDVVAHACDGSRGLADAAGVTIDCRVPADPVTIRGDADRLVQVIANLASNAIQVSRADGSIVIGLVPDRADGRVVVQVDDEGPGVPAEFRDRIFGRFERARGEHRVGTGLGLAISREIIDRHDGRIWFEDRPGGGTRFAFQLDLVRDADATRAGGGGQQLLIVEDDADMAAMLRAMVVAIGHEAQCVGSAAEARAALASGSYAALLLDLRLPDEDGLSLARAVRGQDGMLSLPIIIVSALTRDGVGEPVPIDVIDWIEKPVDRDRLAAAIREAIDRSGARRPTILHLDDDQDMLAVVASALGRDARILTATDLATARTLLETESPDAAILDLKLNEGSSGLDLLPMLTDARGLAIPTIIFSAHDVSAADAGRVDAVLVKSRRSLPDLKATVRRILETRKAPTA